MIECMACLYAHEGTTHPEKAQNQVRHGKEDSHEGKIIR